MTTSVDTEVPDMTAVDAPQQEVPELRVADRCDVGACGAQAWVISMHGEHYLFWCAHHWHGVEPILSSTKVLDHRTMINKSASPSI